MSKSIMVLAAEVDLSKVKPETEKTATNEVAVGTMSNDLIRLYHLHSESVNALCALRKKIEEKMLEHDKLHMEGNPCDEECAKCATEVEKIAIEHDKAVFTSKHLNSIFWGAVRIEFPELLDKERIGVRENFTVIYKKEPTKAEITKEFLGDLEKVMALVRQEAQPEVPSN